MVKSLRMTGQIAGGAGVAKVFETALEEVAVGEDGEGCCAAAFVLRGEFGRVEIFDENAFAGRCFFDLGDNRRAFGT